MAKRGSVLVVDDEEIMRDVLETILSGAGYKVDLAKTGEEALENIFEASLRCGFNGCFDAGNRWSFDVGRDFEN